MREEVSMGGMWPRIYNFAGKSVSARGQVCALSVSSLPGGLVPGGWRVTCQRLQGRIGLHPTENTGLGLPLKSWSSDRPVPVTLCPPHSAQLQAAHSAPSWSHSLGRLCQAPPHVCPAETSQEGCSPPGVHPDNENECRALTGSWPGAGMADVC